MFPLETAILSSVGARLLGTARYPGERGRPGFCVHSCVGFHSRGSHEIRAKKCNPKIERNAFIFAHAINGCALVTKAVLPAPCHRGKGNIEAELRGLATIVAFLRGNHRVREELRGVFCLSTFVRTRRKEHTCQTLGHKTLTCQKRGHGM